MNNILPFEITNEMAVLIGLLGPVVGKACIKKSSQLVSKAKGLALFRGINAWKRERRYSHLKKLRRTRSISPLVYDQISQANTYLILFLLTSMFYVYLVVDSPLKILFEVSRWFWIFLSLPIYYFEVRWLIASDRRKELLKVMRRKSKSVRPVM
ncbi:hypothetical protein [Aeromonas hydrophila]|uniref:hypothetical protein n=1 Tax=Aeromonas hydrophila TaxID=644 RepID=UPI000D0DEF8F|nr:hypothetical protein [Aeromonas hydrophila]AVP86808.1 hypothetical protein C7K70_09715 [Aeromonas hydrophila]